MREFPFIAGEAPRIRLRKALAIGASAAIICGAVALAVKEEHAGRATTVSVSVPVPVRAALVDPLAAEFARCQALGEAGARDAGCLAAWAENRRRFLIPDHRPMAAMPAAPGAR